MIRARGKKYRKYDAKKKSFWQSSFMKTLRIVMICVIVLGLGFRASEGSTVFDYILWEVVAISRSNGESSSSGLIRGGNFVTENVQRRLARFEDIAERNIVGIDDIIIQDYDEFRPFIGEGLNHNFTAEDLDRFYNNRRSFINNFYNIDANVGIIEELFDPIQFLSTDLRVEHNTLVPQVLIFHVHAGTEFFIDSDVTDLYQGVVGAGQRLKYVLENKYGIGVIHITDIFDVVDGVSARGGSYERAEVVIERVLRENPTIEVVLDLHRDGIDPNPNLVTYFDGKPHARLMFVNGVSAMEQNGQVRVLNNLPNDNLEKNLAFSFNMQLAANEMFPGLNRRMLLKPFRYSTHMAGRSLLVEIGSQHSTMEEAFNSMELLADLLYAVVFSQLNN